MTLLSLACFAAALAGVAALWAVWPRTSNTSPLAALFALVWSCTYLLAAVLAWRRNRLAAPAFAAAIGLLAFPLSFLFPGSRFFLLPSCVLVALMALIGYRFVRRVCQAAA
jgi:hypothetical protein